MIRALAILLLCQLAGTILQTATGLPLPGPVIGLVLLLGMLFWRGGPGEELRDTSTGLLKYLGVLFVPAGVGVVGELPTLKANWLPLVVAIPVSTVLGLIVTGLAMQFFLRRQEAKSHA
ncbi:CidA/LrgA family protein [Acidocella sp.]|uniref:CidA/LrgA family protein n=1 Tax=Acidocella sp. TaxID=50710 RepID=UPI0026196B89|nr:CidA/LrgA family protein [Acidocella sp.]